MYRLYIITARQIASAFFYQTESQGYQRLRTVLDPVDPDLRARLESGVYSNACSPDSDTRDDHYAPHRDFYRCCAGRGRPALSR